MRLGTLFFYQLVIKRCFKAFKLNKAYNVRARSKMAEVKVTLAYNKTARVFRALLSTTKQLKEL